MTDELLVDVDTLRAHVQDTYRVVAVDPHGAHQVFGYAFMARRR